jgi:hypothetical protein
VCLQGELLVVTKTKTFLYGLDGRNWMRYELILPFVPLRVRTLKEEVVFMTSTELVLTNRSLTEITRQTLLPLVKPTSIAIDATTIYVSNGVEILAIF